MATNQENLKPEDLRRALRHLLAIAWLWEYFYKRATRRKTRTTDESFLQSIVNAVDKYEEKLPLAKQGKHIIRPIDIHLLDSYLAIVPVFKDLRSGEITPETAMRETLERLQHSGWNIEEEKLAKHIRMLDKRSKRGKQYEKSGPLTSNWVVSQKGPVQAAANLVGRVAQRASRHVILLKRILDKDPRFQDEHRHVDDDTNERKLLDFEQLTRSVEVGPEVLIEYFLSDLMGL